MAKTDVFVLRDSGLEAFLFAEIGTELNGSTLTILSALARLGEDPWAQAARWAKGSRAAAIDLLAADIGRMPLPPHALAEARGTAARLLQLLPSPGAAQAPAPSRGRGVGRLRGLAGREQAGRKALGGWTLPDWSSKVALYAAIALALCLALSVALHAFS